MRKGEIRLQQWCCGQRREKVNKGVRRMPWLFEAKKDVISCEKLRGCANNSWSADVRMGQPIPSDRDTPVNSGRANPGNWNISLPGGKENNSDSLSSGDRTGRSLNQRCFGIFGVVGLRYSVYHWSGNVLERHIRGSENLVHESW